MSAGRRRGAGTIVDYKTRDGVRYRWILPVPVDPENPDAGTRKASKGGYTTVKAADAGLRAAIQDRDRSRRVGSQRAITVGEYAEQWVSGLKLEASTVHGYRKIIRNHVEPQLGAIPLAKLTATRLATHYRELEDHGRRDNKKPGAGLSASTIQKVHVLIGAMLDAALDDGLVITNVAKKRRTVNAPTGKQIRAQRGEIHTWTAEQLNAFLIWDRDTYRDELHPLWHTIAHTGLRRSEALALRWSDVDLNTSRISVRRANDVTRRDVVKAPKTGHARVIDIDPATVSVLRAWRLARGSIALQLARGDAYVFGDDNGRLRNPDDIGRRWDHRVAKAQAALGLDALPRLTLHGLRHTHATLMLGLGIHPKVVQERLGHSNISTTMNIYSHVTPTMQRDAVARLAALLEAR